MSTEDVLLDLQDVLDVLDVRLDVRKMNAKCILIKHKIYGTGDSQLC